METNFNFRSQICTTREQSERLLTLGLKKETADMCLVDNIYDTYHIKTYSPNWLTDIPHIPAWSLHRLIELMPQSIGHLELAVGSDYAGYYEDRCNSELGMYWEYVEETPDMFDNIISTIEWLIKEEYFNKEYLENGN